MSCGETTQTVGCSALNSLARSRDSPAGRAELQRRQLHFQGRGVPFLLSSHHRLWFQGKPVTTSLVYVVYVIRHRIPPNKTNNPPAASWKRLLCRTHVVFRNMGMYTPPPPPFEHKHKDKYVLDSINPAQYVACSLLAYNLPTQKKIRLYYWLFYWSPLIFSKGT